MPPQPQPLKYIGAGAHLASARHERITHHTLSRYSSTAAARAQSQSNRALLCALLYDRIFTLVIDTRLRYIGVCYTFKFFSKFRKFKPLPDPDTPANDVLSPTAHARTARPHPTNPKCPPSYSLLTHHTSANIRHPRSPHACRSEDTLHAKTQHHNMCNRQDAQRHKQGASHLMSGVRPPRHATQAGWRPGHGPGEEEMEDAACSYLTNLPRAHARPFSSREGAMSTPAPSAPESRCISLREHIQLPLRATRNPQIGIEERGLQEHTLCCQALQGFNDESGKSHRKRGQCQLHAQQ